MRRFLSTISILAAIVVLSGVSPLSFPPVSFAQTKEELEMQIADRAKKIEQIEAEIAQIQKSLDSTAQEKKTLQTAIQSIDLSRKKVTSSISLTQNQIGKKDLEIQGLSKDIGVTSSRINQQRDAIMLSLRSLSEQDTDKRMLVSMLAGQNLGSFFASAAASVALREALAEHVEELASLKSDLELSKTSAEDKRKQLASLKSELASQQRLLDQNKKEKDTLLSQTKNKESSYQALLREKQALKSQFEADLQEFESKLNLTIDPASIPKYGSGILSWPVDKPYITQYFGNTEFATQNPQVYSGKGHNGIDLRASSGTNIKAALAGVVKGTGDTDQTCPNASYGKWVLIEHSNGLSTLYAHLSVIRVSKGEEVTTGQSVGYSGNTGYSTGPHLHFAVYASQGVQISTFPSKAAACKGRVYTMPVADSKAYLNPLSYL